MDKEKSKKKIFKVGLIVLLIILLALAGIQIFLSFYLDTYVQKRLTSAVTAHTQGQYELKVKNLHLQIWDGEFQIDSLSLSPSDTASTAPRLEMDRLTISGIQLLPYLFGGNIYTGEIRFSRPVVSITQNSPDSLVFLQSTDSASTQKKNPPRIEVSRVGIEDGAFVYFNQDQSDSLGELHDFNFEITDIRADSATLSNAPFIKYSTIESSSGRFRHQLSDLYALETEGMNISTTNGSLSVDSLKLVPQFPKYEFSEYVGHELDRISLTVGRLLLENADFERLNSGELAAEKFTIENANLDVFHSKMMPSGPPGEKTFPHMDFKNLPFPVTIDTVAIQNATISYTEHLENVSRPGTVTFANTTGAFLHVTNDSARINQEHTIVLEVTSEVMGEATLDAYFEFPMHLHGSHTARGTLGSIQVNKLNPILEPVGLVRASRGTIHSLQFQMDLDYDRSSGWVELIYSDLRIQVLNSGHVDDGGRNRLKTFLANMLKVKRNNDREPFRRGEISYENIEKKSIFSYWWKSLSSGLKDNVGI